MLTSRALQTIDVASATGRRTARACLAETLTDLRRERISRASCAVDGTLIRLIRSCRTVQTSGRSRRRSIFASLTRQTRRERQRIAAQRSVRAGSTRCARSGSCLRAERTRRTNDARALSGRGGVRANLTSRAK
jgi:hypothetical protein